jgi:predicted MFS family arabinose efflux permease
MNDMVALPLWIGTLMQHYRFSPPQAGITVTAFLVAVAVASVWLAPRFNRLPRFANAAFGFSIAAAAFFAIAVAVPVGPGSLPAMLPLHALAGLGVGLALSLTHGGIGRSENPHRLFAIVNVALGVFAIVFLAAMPQVIARVGPTALFFAFAATMGVAFIGAMIAFPDERGASPEAKAAPARLPGAIYLVVAVVVCLTLNQAMVFSFLERVGAECGFGPERVNGVLIALGLVNLLPGVLAALLQRVLSPLNVGLAGPVVQATLALVMTGSATFMPYAVAAALYVTAVIFTHTFLFGLLSRLDPSGRTVAGTPAMMMLGSCAGPAIGGLVVQGLGYEGLGWVACAISTIAVACMFLARSRVRQGASGWRGAGAELAS